MNKRFLSVMLFAFAVAGGASLLMYRLVVTRLSSDAKGGQAKILVAARDLELGTMLKDSDLSFADWSGPAPPHSMQKREDIVGRGVIATTYAGEPVLETRLAPKGAGAGLATLIPKGMRAAAVKVDEVVGLAGFVVPGMRVDVLMSGAPPSEQRSSSESKTILQNIEVLSAGQTFQRDAEGKPVTTQVVNLLVTPEQAETLNVASTGTKIQMVLRNPLDTEQVETQGKVLAQLFGVPAAPVKAPAPAPRAKAPEPLPPPPPKAAPPVKVEVKVVEVVNGTKKTETKFTQNPEDTQ
jgi:pilus assembly protein CpaB